MAPAPPAERRRKAGNRLKCFMCLGAVLLFLSCGDYFLRLLSPWPVRRRFNRLRSQLDWALPMVECDPAIFEPLLMTLQADSPSRGQRLARLEAGQAVPGLEGVRRAGHRLGPESHASAWGAQGVAGVDSMIG